MNHSLGRRRHQEPNTAHRRRNHDVLIYKTEVWSEGVPYNAWAVYDGITEQTQVFSENEYDQPHLKAIAALNKIKHADKDAHRI